uniref:HNH nuclease domain-containing protein n=1 Tax=viral metagenome TaxID=1070528 RepID=A0A6C0C5M7_9ZZZZ
MTDTTNEDVEEQIFDAIKKRSVKENGCSIWKGPSNGDSCFIRHNCYGVRKRTYITKFIWERHHPDQLCNNLNQIVHTCNNPKCFKIEHLKMIELMSNEGNWQGSSKKRKNDDSKMEETSEFLSKEKVWQRLIKKGKFDDTKIYNNKKCFIWTGNQHSGYGCIGINHKTYPVHRLSFWIANDQYDKIHDIPRHDGTFDLHIRHLCSNSLCFEPCHLSLGTASQNNYEDKIIAGTLRRGGNHPKSTISEKKAIQIKLSRYPKDDARYMTQAARAEKFKVKISLVRSIDSGQSWGHLFGMDNAASAKLRERRRNNPKKAKERIWDKKMFEEANKKLLGLSVIDKKSPKYNSSHCRVWQGKLKPDGSPRAIGIHGRYIAPNVLACCIKNNTLDNKNKYSYRKCGNKLCVNADHIEFTSAKTGAGKKLSQCDVDEIRRLFKTGEYTQNILAEKYNVSFGTINSVVTGKY